MLTGTTESSILEFPAQDRLPRNGNDTHGDGPNFSARAGVQTDDNRSTARLTVGICETQPIAVAGLRAVLSTCSDLELGWACDSLAAGLQLARHSPPTLLILDKSFGMQTIIDALSDLRAANVSSSAVVWGVSLTEAEALRFLQAGARGIVRKTSDLTTVVSCIRKVAGGGSWMEDYVFGEGGRPERGSRSGLTPREQQVLELVEQGLKNKDIARELSIRAGTVKIHLKHIFEKTGVRGRYGLALASIKDRGISMTRAAV